MAEVEIVKITGRGGFMIPVELREKLGIKAGDSFVVDGT